MCCVTLQRQLLHDLFYATQPTLVIPLFRAPTTTSTVPTTITTTKITANKILSGILRQESKQVDTTTSSTSAPYMISQRVFENLVLSNTIVAAFCIVLMVTLTGFLIFLLIPSIRRRWLNERTIDETKLENLSTLSRQPSYRHFTLGPSRMNPLFESAAGTTTTTTQFGTLFHPHAATTAVLHPTIWTPMTPASVVSTPVMPPQQVKLGSTPPAPPKTRTKSTATTLTSRPPLPSHSSTAIQKSSRK